MIESHANMRQAFARSNQALRALTPQRRDRRLQVFVAQAQAACERFKAAGSLMNFALMARRQQGDGHRGG